MANLPINSTEFSSLIGDLYLRWTLDGLIQTGYAVSVDFITRPQLYLSDDIPEDIVNLRMSYGLNPIFPNTTQRQTMMLPVLGKSDGLKQDGASMAGQFNIARKKLVDACIAFSERTVDSGIDMLEARVRSSLIPLRAFFEGLKGRSVESSYRQIKSITDIVVKILTAQGIARVFGIQPVPNSWPFTSNDPNGAKLVESVSSLPAIGEYKMGSTKFILLQRVAQEGKKALSMILTENKDAENDLHSLISQVYIWGTSLRDFQQSGI